ncbi:MAG: hypothetical protein HY786_03945, partial [Deltaproteobacteria bacterium]|nr:hypothetical protein [Deltaproteobacteria bacterium]
MTGTAATVLASARSIVDIDATVLVELGLFLLCFLALRSLVFKPLLRLVDERRAQTQGAREEARKFEAEAEAEPEAVVEFLGRIGDPVRMYLKEMGSVSLLTKEKEVEIAKRIEKGEREILNVTFNSPLTAREIMSIGEKIRKGKASIVDVVKGTDDESTEEEQKYHTDKFLRLEEKLRDLDNEKDTLFKKSQEKGIAPAKKAQIGKQMDGNKDKTRETLKEMNLSSRQIERINHKLKLLVEKVD